MNKTKQIEALYTKFEQLIYCPGFFDYEELTEQEKIDEFIQFCARCYLMPFDFSQPDYFKDFQLVVDTGEYDTWDKFNKKVWAMFNEAINLKYQIDLKLDANFKQLVKIKEVINQFHLQFEKKGVNKESLKKETEDKVTAIYDSKFDDNQKTELKPYFDYEIKNIKNYNGIDNQ